MGSSLIVEENNKRRVIIMSKWNNRITVVCILSIAICVCAFLFIYYGNKNEEYDYNEHLDEHVIKVSDDKGMVEPIVVNLQEMAYYIMNVEGDIQQMACQYDSEHPEKYWLIRIESTYDMKDYAKDLAYDSCVRDTIYYMEALKAGVELTKEEQELAANDAKIIMENLTGKQMELSDYTQDVLYSLEKKLYLASKYVNTLTEEGYKMEELELEGSYYKELVSSYNIEVNDEVWDKVVLGELSITQ